MSKVQAAAAERFEVLAGDLIHRMRLVERKDPAALEAHVGRDVLDALKRLETAVAEHACEVAAPLGEQSVLLIERQGERIRALQAELTAAEIGLAKSEKLRREIAAEFGSWRSRLVNADGLTQEQDVLQKEARRELRERRNGSAGAGDSTVPQ